MQSIAISVFLLLCIFGSACVVSRQHAARDYVEHKIVGDDVFALGERPIGSAQYSDDLRARKHPAPEIRRQHTTWF